MAVLFYWNLSRRRFLRQVVDLDLLLCTRFDSVHDDLFHHVRVQDSKYNEQPTLGAELAEH